MLRQPAYNSAHPPPVDRHVTGKAILGGCGDLGQLVTDALREDTFQRLLVKSWTGRTLQRVGLKGEPTASPWLSPAGLHGCRALRQ